MEKVRLAILTICIILILSGLWWCFGISKPYFYCGVESNIIFEPISINTTNYSLREILTNRLNENFTDVKVDGDFIKIRYYDQNYTMIFYYAGSTIEFLHNNSISIFSKAGRYSEDSIEGYFESEEKVKKSSKKLIKEDKAFLKERNDMIVKIIEEIYKINVSYEDYEILIGRIYTGY
jgi:hypothetical protein